MRQGALGERAFDKVLVHSLVRLGRVETELGAETEAAPQAPHRFTLEAETLLAGCRDASF